MNRVKGAQKITLRIPNGLLNQADLRADALFMTRNAYLVHLILRDLAVDSAVAEDREHGRDGTAKLEGNSHGSTQS